MHHPWELVAVSAISAKHNISTAAVAAQDPAFILSPAEFRDITVAHYRPVLHGMEEAEYLAHFSPSVTSLIDESTHVIWANHSVILPNEQERKNPWSSLMCWSISGMYFSAAKSSHCKVEYLTFYFFLWPTNCILYCTIIPYTMTATLIILDALGN